MVSVLHLRKELIRPPVALSVPQVVLRTFELPDDVPNWLELRETAMADQVPQVRSWREDDFFSEMAGKSWWRRDRTWLAVAGGLRHTADNRQAFANDLATPSQPTNPTRAETGRIIGAVTLAMRAGPAVCVPVVHWLLVDPAWRRRGVGRMLVAHLERAVWDAGWREVQLETHAGWQAAVAFYQSIGYAPVRERSPR
jgi:GNAT superfamily N-acetyltransferase